MYIQGDLFVDCYIPDSIVAECREHLLSFPIVKDIRTKPYTTAFYIEVVIDTWDDDAYNELATYLITYENEINKKLGTPILFYPEWLQYS